MLMDDLFQFGCFYTSWHFNDVYRENIMVWRFIPWFWKLKGDYGRLHIQW